MSDMQVRVSAGNPCSAIALLLSLQCCRPASPDPGAAAVDIASTKRLLTGAGTHLLGFCQRAQSNLSRTRLGPCRSCMQCSLDRKTSKRLVGSRAAANTATKQMAANGRVT